MIEVLIIIGAAVFAFGRRFMVDKDELIECIKKQRERKNGIIFEINEKYDFYEKTKIFSIIIFWGIIIIGSTIYLVGTINGINQYKGDYYYDQAQGLAILFTLLVAPFAYGAVWIIRLICWIPYKTYEKNHKDE